MTRILHLVDAGGRGDAPAALARLLPHLDRSSREAVVAAIGVDGPDLERLRAPGVAVVPLGAGEENGALAALQRALDARRLPRVLGGRRFDLVHSRGPTADLLARLAGPRLGASAIVATFDGSHLESDGWRRRTDRRTAGRVTRFVLPAAALEAVLTERYGPDARCTVIPDGIALAEADAGLAVGRAAARARFGLRPVDVAIAHAGALDADAGAVHLVAAFHALLRTQPTARLLIAGEGPARAALEAAAGAMRLGPFLRFLGALPDPWPLLAASDVFVLPALRCASPVTLLEAMAAGLPAVATTAGAIPETAADGREALLVPPADPGALGRALADLAAAPARRREMGTLARRRVEECFRIERTAAALDRLYRELAAGGAAAG